MAICGSKQDKNSHSYFSLVSMAEIRGGVSVNLNVSQYMHLHVLECLQYIVKDCHN